MISRWMILQNKEFLQHVDGMDVRSPFAQYFVAERASVVPVLDQGGQTIPDAVGRIGESDCV